MSLDHLAEIVLDPGIPPLLIYSVVFLSCILESFFPPWPTDLIVLYAAFLAGRGQLEQWLVLAAAITGTQVGVMAIFWLARRYGPALLGGPLGRVLPPGGSGSSSAGSPGSAHRRLPCRASSPAFALS